MVYPLISPPSFVFNFKSNWKEGTGLRNSFQLALTLLSEKVSAHKKSVIAWNFQKWYAPCFLRKEKNPVQKKLCQQGFQRIQLPEKVLTVPEWCKCEVEGERVLLVTTLDATTSSTLAKVRYYAILRQTQLCQINGEALGADFGKFEKFRVKREKTTKNHTFILHSILTPPMCKANKF